MRSNADSTLHCGPYLPGGSMHALASSLQCPPHRLQAALHDDLNDIASTDAHTAIRAQCAPQQEDVVPVPVNTVVVNLCALVIVKLRY